MVIATIHQPNYLPYLGFFDKMIDADILILYDNTQFKSEDFQNRNRIRVNTAQGWIWLTIPVTHQLGTLIKDVKIIDQHWRKTHWKSIETNYAKAPYFKEYRERFTKIYDTEWNKLSDFNIALIKEIKEILGIKTQIILASELIPDMKSKSTQALIDLCIAVNADTYLSGTDGEHYLKLELFEKEKIKVLFQKYKHPEYKQVFNEFKPYMCILDLIFNHGPESVKILRSKNITH